MYLHKHPTKLFAPYATHDPYHIMSWFVICYALLWFSTYQNGSHERTRFSEIWIYNFCVGGWGECGVLKQHPGKDYFRPSNVFLDLLGNLGLQCMGWFKLTLSWTKWFDFKCVTSKGVVVIMLCSSSANETPTWLSNLLGQLSTHTTSDNCSMR